jgi:hypothetical protein
LAVLDNERLFPGLILGCGKPQRLWFLLGSLIVVRLLNQAAIKRPYNLGGCFSMENAEPAEIDQGGKDPKVPSGRSGEQGNPGQLKVEADFNVEQQKLEIERKKRVCEVVWC